MPRQSKSFVPKYRKHRASGQAVVTINGADHYLGPHGTKASRLEYDRLISEWLASGRSPAYGAPEHDLTVVELVAAYRKFARSYYGTGKRGTYATMKRITNDLKDLYGRLNVVDFGPLQFKALRQRLIDKDLSRGYINDTMKRVVQVFRWGASEGMFAAAIVQNLAIIPGLRKGRRGIRETQPVEPVDKKLVEATLPHLSTVVADMVRLQMLTGARPGEICRLTPGCIDRTGDVWEAKLADHKTSHLTKKRTIYLGPQAQEVLRRYLLRGSNDFCFSPAEAVQEMRDRRNAERKTPPSCGNRVGTNRRRSPKRRAGSCYTAQSYNSAIRRACVRARLERWSPNQLRHLVATNVRRDFDLDAAKTLLGHSQIGVTEIYAEKDRCRAIEVARKIG